MQTIVDSDDDDNSTFLSSIRLRCTPKKADGGFESATEAAVVASRTASSHLFSASCKSGGWARSPTVRDHSTRVRCCVGATEDLSIFPREPHQSPVSPKRPRDCRPSGSGNSAEVSSPSKGARVEAAWAAPIPLTWIMDEASRLLAVDDATAAAQRRVREYCESNRISSPTFLDLTPRTPLSGASTSKPPIASPSRPATDIRFDVGRLSGTFQTFDELEADDQTQPERSLLHDYPPPSALDWLEESSRVLSHAFDD